MRQIKIYISSIAFLLLAATVYASSFESTKADKLFSERKSSAVESQDITLQVKEAFDQVRKTGETARLTQLENFGEKLISYLEPYLNDANTNVRTEAVNSALKIGGEKALDFAVLALKNPRPQVQRITAMSIHFYYSEYIKYLRNEKPSILSDYTRYKSFSPENISVNRQLGDALRRIVETGNSNIETIFLLANFPGSETEAALENSFKRKNYARSLRIRDEKALATEITLARLANQEAIKYLSKQTNTQNIETLKFLLKNITEINSPEILLALSKTLENKTYIEGNLSSVQIVRKFRLPKGSHVDTIPRRLCDLAVESFVKKLNLETSFKLHSGIYAEKHLLEAQELTRKTLSGK